MLLTVGDKRSSDHLTCIIYAVGPAAFAAANHSQVADRCGVLPEKCVILAIGDF